MTRRSTIRLPVAVLLAASGAILAILTGRPDAAILVSPWAVLLAFGLSGTARPSAAGTVRVDRDRVLADESVTVTAEIHGARGWIETVCVPEDGFGFDGRAEPEEAALETAGAIERDQARAVRSRAEVATPGRTATIDHTLTASGWGSHDVGRINLDVHEPYGLLHWSGVLHTPTLVRVHPNPIDVQRLLMPWLVRRLTGAHPSSAIGRGVEFADIRRFGAGDSLRDINWRVSARSNELWVSERHPDRSTDVVLLLDTFTESGHDVRTLLAMAMEAAITLAESHLSVNDRVGVIEVGGIIRWVGLGTGRYQLERLTDALLATRLYENAADRPLTAIPPRALPPRSFVVALSPLLDERFITTVLTLRGSGHDVSVIEYPAMTPEGRQRRSTTPSADLALRLWEAERQTIRDQLASRGVVVGRWDDDQHLDQVLAEVASRRQTVRAMAGR